MIKICERVWRAAVILAKAVFMVACLFVVVVSAAALFRAPPHVFIGACVIIAADIVGAAILLAFSDVLVIRVDGRDKTDEVA